MRSTPFFSIPSSEDGLQTLSFPSVNGTPNNPRRKRRPAGCPDPDAEVVYLTAEMLMESDRYVCEICNQSFQREQNLQMHRRRHKVPWKLLRRDKAEAGQKRVYVCPELSCLHHDPTHALGDLVGIKKHYRRKHSNQKQWVCDKCSKAYAVLSDYKAHLKICGTKGHSCDCGRVFSRVETFIEHQDSCKAGINVDGDTQVSMQADLTPSFNLGFSSNNPSWPDSGKTKRTEDSLTFHVQKNQNHGITTFHHNLELELFSSSTPHETPKSPSPSSQKNINALSNQDFKWLYGIPVLTNQQQCHDIHNPHDQIHYYFHEAPKSYCVESTPSHEGLLPSSLEVMRMKKEAKEMTRMAVEQKALAEEKREAAKRLTELAKQEMAKARKIREDILAEYRAAEALKFDCSSKQVRHGFCQITCRICKNEFQAQVDQESGGEEFSGGSTFNLSSFNNIARSTTQEEFKGLMLWV